MLTNLTWLPLRDGVIAPLLLNLGGLCDLFDQQNKAEVILCQFLNLSFKRLAVSTSCILISLVLEASPLLQGSPGTRMESLMCSQAKLLVKLSGEIKKLSEMWMSHLGSVSTKSMEVNYPSWCCMEQKNCPDELCYNSWHIMSFAYVDKNWPSIFTEGTFLYSLFCSAIFAINQMSTHMWISFWGLYSLLFVLKIPPVLVTLFF